MKFLCSIVLLLALGLSATSGLDFGEDGVDANTQGFMDHVMEDGFEEDEIVDMDDALEKARMLKAMAKMVAEAEAMDLMNPKKRFIGGFFSKVKDAIVNAAKKVGNFFKGAWEKAKNAFSKVAHGINFKATVQKLIPFIHSGATVGGCTTALTAAASAVLGPAAPLASVVAGPLCNAALSKLQDIAG